MRVERAPSIPRPVGTEQTMITLLLLLPNLASAAFDMSAVDVCRDTESMPVKLVTVCKAAFCVGHRRSDIGNMCGDLIRRAEAIEQEEVHPDTRQRWVQWVELERARRYAGNQPSDGPLPLAARFAPQELSRYQQARWVAHVRYWMDKMTADGQAEYDRRARAAISDAYRFDEPRVEPSRPRDGAVECEPADRFAHGGRKLGDQRPAAEQPANSSVLKRLVDLDCSGAARPSICAFLELRRAMRGMFNETSAVEYEMRILVPLSGAVASWASWGADVWLAPFMLFDVLVSNRTDVSLRLWLDDTNTNVVLGALSAGSLTLRAILLAAGTFFDASCALQWLLIEYPFYMAWSLNVLIDLLVDAFFALRPNLLRLAFAVVGHLMSGLITIMVAQAIWKLVSNARRARRAAAAPVDMPTDVPRAPVEQPTDVAARRWYEQAREMLLECAEEDVAFCEEQVERARLMCAAATK